MAQKKDEKALIAILVGLSDRSRGHGQHYTDDRGPDQTHPVDHGWGERSTVLGSRPARLRSLRMYECNTLWRDIAELQTDDQVRLLYNHFNQNYGEEYSLIEWIEDEWAFGQARTDKNAALARLNKAVNQ